MSELKFLLLLIAGYLIVFVESIDIENILYSFYYAIWDFISPSHIMPEIVEKIFNFFSIAVTLIILLKFLATNTRKN
jgi:hypothetical protein